MTTETVRGSALSPQQKRAFALAAERPLAATSALYAVSGDLDLARLTQALRRVVERHEILRTRVSQEEGVWVQAIEAEPRFALSEGEPGEESPDPPPLGVRLLHAGDGRRLLFEVPPWCGDGRSLRNLAREVVLAYAGGSDDDVAVQYSDVAPVFNQLLQAEETATGREFWRSRRGHAEAPRLPEPLAGASAPQPALGPELLARLAALAVSWESSLADLLAAAWLILLARLGVGGAASVAFDGRDYEGLGEALGPFARYLPVSAEVDGDLPGRAACSRIARQLAELARYQDFFDWSRTSEVGFAFAPRTRAAAGGLTLDLLRERTGGERFALHLSCVEAPDGLALELDADPGACTPAAAGALTARFAILLAALAETPEAALGDLALLLPTERKTLLAVSGPAPRERPAGLCAHHLFESQARRTPHAVALVCEGRRSTYAELDETTDRLACRLVRRGVGPETAVGIALPRSPEMVIAVLAVLKAGGAYVPIDPAHPAPRRAFVMRDAGIALLLAPAGAEPELAGVEILDPSLPGVASGESRNVPCSADNLAYVLYTSGSTGRPKGVLVHHRGLVNYLFWCRDAYGLGPGTSAPVHSPLSFDLTVTSLLAPLAWGGTVVLAADDKGVEILAATLSTSPSWSLLKITPAHLEALGHLFAEGAVPDLRCLVVGGEALHGESLAFWAHRTPEARIVNEYGPTETVVGSCTFELRAADAAPGAVPVGRPIDNARILLTSPRMQPVPGGVAGEICIGGLGVARGYLGRPDTTAERFVPDPWGAPGSRLYRTGDLGRWRSDGELEFLGRADHQVKVRGYRIEPGEIEAALRRHSEVREALVLAREHAAGDRRLVAYVVPSAPPGPDAEALRSFLEGELPEYMVPAAFVSLSALPLTANGKVDRLRLPAPWGDDGGGQETAAPRNPTEALLVALWTEVLQVSRIGIHDSFFRLGGDSLLSIRIVARARRAGLSLAPRQIFQYPTVAELASVVAPAERQEPKTETTASLPFSLSGLAASEVARLFGKDPGIEDAFPLSPTQQGMVLHQLYAPGSSAYFVQNSWTLRGDFDLLSYHRAWQRVVDRHAILRTSFLWKGVAAPLQVVHRRLRFPWREEDWRGVDPAEQRVRIGELLEQDRRLGVDLERAPLIRLTAVRLADDAWWFCRSFHHSLLDAWSLAEVTREVVALYEGFRREQPPQLDPPVPFREYIAWIGRQDAAQLEDFWRRHLDGFPGATRLAVDRAPGRPAVGGEDTRGIWSRLSPQETAELRAAAAGLEVTPNILVQGAVALLLGRYSGSTDVLFGATVSGRPPDLPGVESIVGPLINTLPVRVPLPAQRAVARWLRELQDRRLALGPYEHSSAADVQRWSGVPGGESLFDCVLIFDNRPPEAAAANWQLGLTLSDQQGFGRVSYPLTVAAAFGTVALLGMGYDRERFADLDVARMATQLRALLLAVAADPDRPLWLLSPFSPAERHQMLLAWSGGAPDPSRVAFESVARLFARQVARSPQAVAIVDESAAWTYRELSLRVEGVAAALRARGVGAEDLVALHAERSCETVASLLGILAAGAAYLPLDPGHPPERLARLLADSGARRLDDVLAAPAQSGSSSSEPAADGLAYAIYTSGSTGVPKAVLITHGSLSDFTRKAAEAYGIGPGDRVLQFASLTFDASVEEVFPCLTRGAALVLRGERMLDSVPRFLAECRRRGITVLDLPTAFWHELVPVLEEGEELPPAVRLVILGGEAALPHRVAAWRRLVSPGVRLVNTYGPTEGTVVATACDLSSDFDEAAVPIGRPLPEVRAYVLDDALQPVPLGVQGELFLGGAGVARGYLGRPAATAERFVPDPHAGAPGARLLRTGDRALHLADGRLVFVGRADRQVKVRGFRIEPGEVEAALCAYPGLRQASVVAVEPEPGARQLVAYLAAEPGTAPSAEALRAFLAERLPPYMVPSAFTLLEALPLTSGGKVDRRALPALTPRPSAAAEDLGTTPAEEIMAGIWSEILGRQDVARQEDFFALGGHSLLAMRVLTRVRSAFGVDLPLRRLFEAPTVAGLTRHVEQLRRTGDLAPSPPIVPVRRDARLPLSFAQQRLWFLDLMDPGNPAYNVSWPVRVGREPDLALLAASLSEVVRRHEVLRTVFAAVEGEAEQVILEHAPPALAVVDLTGLPAADRRRAGHELAEAEARRPFDLARGPLLRVAAVLADEDSTVLTSMHHIVSDGWSIGIFKSEVAALHDAFRQGRPSPLAELPVQYADFAVWQRQRLAGEGMERDLAYWRERLAQAPPVLELPFDRPRPAVQSSRGACRRMHLSPAAEAQLRRLGRRQASTLFITLLAAFQALLARWSGQSDVSVGTPISGRNRLEVEGLIGFFVNTLVVRVQVEATATFAALLDSVREAVLQAHEHQELPFEKLVEEIAPQRSLSHSPLFQVMFSLNLGERQGGRRLPTPRSPDPRPERTAALFDLSAAVEETTAGLAGTLIHNTDLFDGPTVERLAGYFSALLDGLAADPERSLADLPWLPAAERVQLLVEWNDSGALAAPGCIPALFAAQAARTPDAVALVSGEQAMSYRALERRADHLARALRAAGVGPEKIVGVCLERSPEMVATLLAVLQAGGAYLPMDPRYPPERLRYMLEDAEATAVVTREELLASLPGEGIPALCVERLAGEADGATAVAVDPDQLAYVIYTSGSTGRPKGVAVAHRSAACLVAWAAQTFSPGELDGVLAATSICFDLSVFELFVPLCLGGRVILVEDALHLLDAPAGAQLINTVPSVLGELLHHQTLPSTVQTVNLAGEPLPRELAERLHAARVYNLYGPSEDTTYSTVARIEPGEPGPPPIGRPIAGTRVHLLDARLEPVPVGVTGEIFLAGAGLARGYLRRPDLTAERFVPDPFDGDGGGRLYRTGDLARRRGDGQLEFLGRIDHQVKVRGFRIELGEIESALRRHPGVQEAVVVALDDRSGDRRLVAYVVAQPAPAAPELREHLRQTLPDYMLPAAFVFLAALPLTPNGKVDRRALPAPEESGAGAEPPRGPFAELLAEIWAEVLGNERRAGEDDDFFALGGHSLLAVKLVSRLRAVFGVELGVRSVFEAPTVASLARRIERARQAGELALAPPILPLPRDRDLPLSFAQQRLWFLDQLAPDSPAYNIASATRIEGTVDLNTLERCLGEIVRRHEALRTVFAAPAGEPLQVILPPAPVHVPVVDLGALPAAERRRAAASLQAAEALRPFDLARGPLLRVTLLAGGEASLLLTTMHHVVSDGWSLEVFTRELRALYQAFRAGRPSPLAELPVQYADFAWWQRSWLAGEILEGELAYWRAQLAGAPPLLELPTDRARPAVQGFAGALRPIRLTPGVEAPLRRLAREQGATLFMALLAAFQAFLARWTGQSDLCVGTPVAGRNRLEIEGLIGFFVNTLVLRVEVSEQASFPQLLGRVREVVLDAHAHQELPFEKLVEDLAPRRSLAYSPLFQVMFLLGAADGRPAVMEASPETQRTAAKLDLTLALEQSPEGLAGAIEHNTDLFDGTTVERLAGAFAVLLDALAAEPERSLAALPWHSPGERAQLRALPAPEPLARLAQPVAPRDELELALAGLWEQTLGVSPVGVRDDFFELGGHSLLGVRLLAQIRRRFASDLPLVALFEAPTVERMAARLRRRTAGAAASPLVALQPAGTRPPLFFVHPVGGNVLCYLDLARSLGPEQPFYGLEAVLPSLADVPGLARRYLDALRAVRPHGPYRLGGWSMGGLVAFEMARQLDAAGEPVALVALLDTRAPGTQKGDPEAEPERLARLFARDLEALTGEPVTSPPGDLPADLQRLFAIFKDNLRAMYSYAPHAYPGPVTLFLAGEGNGVEDAALAWRSFAEGGGEIHRVPGDHYSLLRRPHVELLAERLRACLDGCPGKE